MLCSTMNRKMNNFDKLIKSVPFFVLFLIQPKKIKTHFVKLYLTDYKISLFPLGLKGQSSCNWLVFTIFLNPNRKWIEIGSRKIFCFQDHLGFNLTLADLRGHRKNTPRSLTGSKTVRLQLKINLRKIETRKVLIWYKEWMHYTEILIKKVVKANWKSVYFKLDHTYRAWSHPYVLIHSNNLQGSYSTINAIHTYVAYRSTFQFGIMNWNTLCFKSDRPN